MGECQYSDPSGCLLDDGGGGGLALPQNMEDPGRSWKILALRQGRRSVRWPEAFGVMSLGPASMLDLPGVEEEGPDGPRCGVGVVPAGLESGFYVSTPSFLLDLPGGRGEVPQAPLSLLSLSNILNFYVLTL